jgi:hypothetical protein
LAAECADEGGIMTVPVTSGEALWLECAQQLPAAPRLLA